MENNYLPELAEKIALLLQNKQNGSEEFLRKSLEKINQRLDKIESHLFAQPPKSAPQSPKLKHASQEKFKSLEELADEIIAHLQNEKACPYEPTGKPCDHCAMCNSRGF